MKIPYKTCRILMILEPKTQKGIKNNQKSINFIDKTHMAFLHDEKPYKTCRKIMFRDIIFHFWVLFRPPQILCLPSEIIFIIIFIIIIRAPRKRRNFLQDQHCFQTCACLSTRNVGVEIIFIIIFIIIIRNSG